MKAANGTVLVVLGKMLLIVNSPLPPAHSVEVADISLSSKEELVSNAADGKAAFNLNNEAAAGCKRGSRAA